MSSSDQQSQDGTDPNLVFVCDDDAQVRLVLVLCLEYAGFRVRSFPAAAAVLEALDQGGWPRVLVTDYQMPGMNGLELIAASREVLPGLKTVSISGTPELVKLNQSRCRPDRLLSKPFLPSELITTIRELVGDFDHSRQIPGHC